MLTAPELAAKLTIPMNWLYVQIRKGRLLVDRQPSGAYLFNDTTNVLDGIQSLRTHTIDRLDLRNLSGSPGGALTCVIDESHQLRRRKANRGLCQLRPMKAVSLEAFRERANVRAVHHRILTQSAGLTLNTNRAQMKRSRQRHAPTPSAHGPFAEVDRLRRQNNARIGSIICGVSVIR